MLPLTVIICTYHREKAVGDTLALLFGPKVQSAGSVDLRVILVDQGRTLQRADFPADWNLRIVHQDNFGGAGGFTRGMIEAMDEGAGWILLMDDDATPDPASFPILADYIRGRAPETRFALHGTMFSSEQPDTIYEAGATIKEPRDRNFDIVQRLRGYKPTTLIEKDPKLWENMDIDYGAWWFFCLHKDSIREVGLPLPLFIRGDDREYGLRLKAAGIATIPLPGLRIWHTAQGVRSDTWPMFFDQRNKLIAHALYHDEGRCALAARMTYAGMRDIFSARYDLARTSIMGLVAYLEGPKALHISPKAVLQRAREVAQPMIATAACVTTTHMAGQVERGRLFRIVIQFIALNGLLFPAKKQAGLPVAETGCFDWLRTYRLSDYGLMTPKGDLRIYRRSRRVAARLLADLAVNVWRYVARFSQTRAAWRAAVPAITDAAFWRSHLAMDPRADQVHQSSLPRTHMNVLAHIVPPSKPEIRPLFYGQDTTARGDSSDSAITLEEGSLLSFEGYFNVFFEAPFTKLTDLKEISLQLMLEGRFEVTIQRTNSSGARQLIHATEQDFRAQTPFTHTASLNSQDSGYLSFSILSKEPGARFLSGAWMTATQPLQDVRLAGVICTYRREEQLRQLISSLACAPELSGQPLELLAVDNSTSMSPDALAEFGCRVIPQENCGGAGGFTRGILEVLSDDSSSAATHVLLMDDDIEILPETLFRAIQFLRYQTMPAVLGAPLLDLHEPCRIDVSGEVFDTGRSALSPRSLHGRLEALGKTLPRVARIGATDWTGWWFSIFPREVFQENLPLPVFVRGDDIEFGLRLKSQNMASSYVPGWALWHEPFGSPFARVPDWIHYYNTRNGLIHRALHAEDLDARKLAWQIFTQQFNHYIYTFQYGVAELLLMGAEDFLRGPDTLFSICPRQLHSRAIAAVQRSAPTVLNQAEDSPPAQPPHVPWWEMVAGLLTLHGHALPREWSRRKPIRLSKRNYRRRHTVGREEIHVADENTGQTLRFRRCRTQFRALYKRRTQVRRHFIRDFQTIAAMWRSRREHNQTPDFWRQHLDLKAHAKIKKSAFDSVQTTLQE